MLDRADAERLIKELRGGPFCKALSLAVTQYRKGDELIDPAHGRGGDGPEILLEYDDGYRFVRDAIGRDAELTSKFGFPFPPTLAGYLRQFPLGKRSSIHSEEGNWIQRLHYFIGMERLYKVVASEAVLRSSSWTGISNSGERLETARVLLPAAQASIEQLMIALNTSGHNNGPPLDDVIGSLEALQKLHSVLGDILVAMERGTSDKELAHGLVAEVIKYARRAVENVRSEPLALSLTIWLPSIFLILGQPNVAAGIAMVGAVGKKSS